MERYKKQLPLIGEEGQKKLKNSKIVVVGVGGLGSVVSTYLTAVGIGNLVLVDYDKVEKSNLNRQILHWTNDLDKEKIFSAKEKLKKMNPEANVSVLNKKIETKDDLIKSLIGIDAIVDCTDNFDIRYIINDISLEMKIPLFHGACQNFEGRVSTIIPGKTACLKCLYPKKPPEQDFSIIGSVAGTIGSMQATEVIKYILKKGKLLENKLLVYDAKRLIFDIIKLKKNPTCHACGGLK